MEATCLPSRSPFLVYDSPAASRDEYHEALRVGSVSGARLPAGASSRIRSSPQPVCHSDTLIARGNGRSYGDVALDPDLMLSMLKMDRFRSIPRRYCSTALRSEYSTHGMIVTGLRSRVLITSISIGFSSFSTVCWRGAGYTGDADSCNTHACCRGTKVRPASGRRLIESPRLGKVRF